MRKLFLLSVLLLAAACSDHLSVDPTHVDLAVGQTATITATRLPADWQGTPWAPSRIDFVGSGAVSANGVMAPSDQTATITVQGLAPGSGTVSSDFTEVHTGHVHNTVATVTVFDCSRPVALTPASATVAVKVGDPVRLTVIPSVLHGHYQWYLGARGDTGHPLALTDTPSFDDFPSSTAGSFSLWVRYSTICGTADAAFVVNVGGLARRRGVAH